MQELFAIKYSFLIPLLPLAGAAISGFFGAKWLRGKSHWPVWIGVGCSLVLSLWLLFGMLGYWNAPAVSPSTATGTEDQQVIGYSQDWFHWVTAGNPENVGKPGHDSFFDATAGAWFDPLTAVMLCVVTGVSLIITIYSAGYMKGEDGYFRFFAYMGLFVFMMTCLVMGNNLLMLYLGWEGVGLCSYLLIGYYYQRPAAREAAKKAFLVNRVGDFGFGIGVMLCFLAFGTVSFFGQGIHTNTGLLELVQSNNLTGFQHHALQWIPFLLLIGACGKSAQFPLYVWLPDAMEGPTPVSALIHAATMVTAGVYMMVRCGTLFVGNSDAMWTIAAVGCFTALLSATIALRQFDLKKVFAYSTVSQLGFMFVAVGCLAPVAGIFHLMTHAFFKALLFLSCGVVMHAMAGQLDMRTMSGLKRVLPKTRWLMLIGCLSLAGCPLLSGFFSKDDIISSAWTQNRLLGLLMLFAAFLTAYYTFRLYFRVFEGPLILPEGVAHPAASLPEAHATASSAAVHTGDTAISGVDTQLATDPADHGKLAQGSHGHGHGDEHDHEPGIMIWPLVLLAIGAIFAGYLNFPERAASFGSFLGSSPSLSQSFNAVTRSQSGYVVDPAPFGQFIESEAQTEAIKAQTSTLHWMMMGISALVFAAGVYLAYLGHLKYRAADDRLAVRLGPITRLIEGKFFVDEIYQACLVEPLRALGRLFYGTDRFAVDGAVGFFSFVPQGIGWLIKFTTQRGYLQGYAASMLFCIAIILIVMLWG
jgi:NADH-quinone oxidoreductase subunit L